MNRATLFVVLSCVGCGTGPGFDGEIVGSSEQALSNKDFDVDFSGCSEFAGIGLVPAAFGVRGAAPLWFCLKTAKAVLRPARQNVSN